MADEPGGPDSSRAADGDGGPERPDTSYGAASPLNTGQPCPSCGVKVSAGYPKCPKCHAPMPAARNPVTGRIPTVEVAGGTTVTGSRDNRAVVAAVVGALVIVVGIGVLVTRPGPQVALAIDAADGGAVPATEADAEVDDVVVDLEADDGSAAREELLQELSAALRQQRLWSSVGFDDEDTSTGHLESDFCEEEALQATVDGISPKLKVAGFAAIQCYSKHGALVFEREY